MPRYFFHVLDDEGIMDEVGEPCSDLNAARQLALRYAGTLITEMGHGEFVEDDWKMDVCDESGLVLFSFMFFGLDGALSIASGRPKLNICRAYHSRPDTVPPPMIAQDEAGAPRIGKMPEKKEGRAA